MGPTPFYGARAEKTQKADFAMKQTNICRLSGDINYSQRRPMYSNSDVTSWFRTPQETLASSPGLRGMSCPGATKPGRVVHKIRTKKRVGPPTKCLVRTAKT